MILVTGSNGFIGNALVKKLNRLGFVDIVALDPSVRPNNQQVVEYVSRIEDLESLFSKYDFEIVYHLGATSSTKVCKETAMADYEFTKRLFDRTPCPVIYASSAAIYNDERQDNPKSFYAYSKYLVEQYANYLNKRVMSSKYLTGLRFFNVYGTYKQERHKEGMMSPIAKFTQEAFESGYVTVYTTGAVRDFVHVDDVVDSMISMSIIPGQVKRPATGVFDVGTGTSYTFTNIAEEVVKLTNAGKIKYKEPPPDLLRGYQYKTRAQVSENGWISLQEGVKRSVESYRRNL